MLTFAHADAVDIVRKNLGSEAVEELGSKVADFLAFPELEAAVREDVEFLKGSRLLGEGVAVSGWIYEVEMGRTRRVV
jgi:carbonic anhydrase